MTEPSLVHDLLDDAAARSPEATAFTYAGQSMTYEQLAAASRTLATWLREHGLGRGDRLLIAVANHLYVPALLYAASRTGVVFSVVHEQVRGAVQRHILNDFAPSIVVSDEPHWREAATAQGAAAVAPSELEAAMRLRPADGDAPGPITVDPVCLIYTSG
ncbi:MAG: AMP-binding protein, partial [Stackebrandtia sp.]